MKNPRGISLVEVVVYLGILAVVVLLLTFSIIQLGQTWGKARSERKVASAAEGAFERITRELRLACTINALGSGTITLNTFQDQQSAAGCNPAPSFTRRINLKSFQIVLDDDSNKALTPSDVTVSNLIFTQLALGQSGQQAVRFSATFSTGSGRYATQRNYYGAAVLRGSYSQ